MPTKPENFFSRPLGAGFTKQFGRSGGERIPLEPEAPTISLVQISPATGAVGGIFYVIASANGIPRPVRTWEWLLNGEVIPGADGTVFESNAPGYLSARLTVTNSEGSASLESEMVLVKQDEDGSGIMLLGFDDDAHLLGYDDNIPLEGF